LTRKPANACTSRYNDGYANEASSLSDAKRVANKFDEVCEYVELVDLYIPSEQIIVTQPWVRGGTFDRFLNIAEYEGPETGPYHMLGYAFAGDNLLPIPPAGVWYDLHVMANKLARKIGRQADRMKRVLAFEGGAAEDVAEIVNANDGETVRVDNVDAIKELTYGGTSEEAYQHMEWLKAQFQEMAGHVDQLAGGTSDTPTLGQAEIQQSNSSVRLSDMQQMVYNFTGEVGRDLMFFLHTDPLIELPLVRRVQGVEQQVMYTPEMRQGEWLDYTIKCKAQSMARTDPQVKARRVLEFAQNVVPAAAQAFQLLGPAFNLERFLLRVAEEIGLDEVDDIINSPLLQQRMQQMMMRLPPDGNMARMAGGGAMPPAGPPALPGGGRPGQPNPGQMGPSGGMSPDQESNQIVQEPSAENQRFSRPSIQQVAMSRV
jgi:hypothetical protein